MIRLDTILVATDFGEAADTAVRYGRELARKFGAVLHLFHTVDDLASRALALQADVIPDMLVSQREVEVDNLARLEALLSDEDRDQLRARASVTTSNLPAEAIVAQAEQVGANLIVIGTHGRGPLTHLLLGSVAERVVRMARCPVLTVRHPEQEFVVPDALETIRHSEAG